MIKKIQTNKKKQQRILVTGASGFIGNHLIRYLGKKGFMVRGMVRKHNQIIDTIKNIHYIIGDMTDHTSIENATKNIDIVIHLAACKSDEDTSYETNVTGMKNLIQACKKNGIKLIINITSASIKIKNKGIYAQTKKLADEILISSGYPSITLMPSIIYGTEDKGAFHKLMTYARNRIVPVIGNGLATLQPIYIDDLVHFIYIASTKKDLQNEVYEIGGPNLINMNDFIRLIAKVVWGHNKILLLHIPIWFGIFIRRMFKIISKKPPFSKSNILGSTQDILLNTEYSYYKFGFTPRGVPQGLKDMIIRKK